MLLNSETNVVYKLFQHDPDHVSETAADIEHRLQFLSLELMHRLYAPSIMRSFAGNCMGSFKDP